MGERNFIFLFAVLAIISLCKANRYNNQNTNNVYKSDRFNSIKPDISKYEPNESSSLESFEDYKVKILDNNNPKSSAYKYANRNTNNVYKPDRFNSIKPDRYKNEPDRRKYEPKESSSLESFEDDKLKFLDNSNPKSSANKYVNKNTNNVYKPDRFNSIKPDRYKNEPDRLKYEPKESSSLEPFEDDNLKSLDVFNENNPDNPDYIYMDRNDLFTPRELLYLTKDPLVQRAILSLGQNRPSGNQEYIYPISNTPYHENGFITSRYLNNVPLSNAFPLSLLAYGDEPSQLHLN